MKGKRGIWTVVIVSLVACLLGIATIPLLKERRRREVKRTQLLLEQLGAALQQYRLKHGELPSTLGPFGDVRDAWGRPLTYRVRGHEIEIHSLGPDPNDPKDDISSSDPR